MKTTVVIEVDGYIGDTLLASSVAQPLKEENSGIWHLALATKVKQSAALLLNNPYIDEVMHHGVTANGYFQHYHLGQVDQSEPATIQFQRVCGIKVPRLEYQVYTDLACDQIARQMIDEMRAQSRKKVVAFQANWKERSFGFTREEYTQGIDHPMGYGQRRRNIDKILSILASKVSLIKVGYPDGTPVDSIGIFSMPIYTMTASIIKACDFMIGAEGGLTNLAAGVGTRCILTHDFVHQVYGWNGSVRQIQNPQMGPAVYFPESGHVHLDPFLTDEEVAHNILEKIG